MGEGAYDPERHRLLRAAPWREDRVRDALRDVAVDFLAARRADGTWPTHPLDCEDTDARWHSPYAGAAGAIVSLRVLHAAGFVSEDPSEALPGIHAAWLKRPEHGPETGLQLGHTGILTPAVLAGVADAPLVDRLEAAMRSTLGHAARETTSGEAGVMHAAWTLHEATGDERWGQLYEQAAHSLWVAWRRRASGDWLWESDIFGSVRGYYGACHGVAGNVHALLRGASRLPDEWPALALARCVGTLERGALRTAEGFNWPVSADASGTRRLVQWCHGAPGVVTALAAAPAHARLDALLEAAAEFTWNAGPLAKGVSVCHGTAGNGYAFLKLWQRTGERRWLDRARVFAMHAIGQCERARERYGQGRYTLWTGDGGFAAYLVDCLAPENAALPGLERF